METDCILLKHYYKDHDELEPKVLQGQKPMPRLNIGYLRNRNKSEIKHTRI